MTPEEYDDHIATLNKKIKDRDHIISNLGERLADRECVVRAQADKIRALIDQVDQRSRPTPIVRIEDATGDALYREMCRFLRTVMLTPDPNALPGLFLAAGVALTAFEDARAAGS